MIQINNLGARIAHKRQAIDSALQRVVDSGWLVLGPEVKGFEQAFAAYVGVAHCLSVANGTDAIELALKALGVGAGDRVATVANAGMYTGTALGLIGAEPYFMDVAPDSRCAPLAEVQRATAAGVKAVVVTHLYGLAAPDIAAIAAHCASAGVALLEDCAQAHGALIVGQRVGSFGDAASFSFYPTKNLGALGDGGAIVCRDAALAERIGLLRQYGWSAKYQVAVAGARNSRLDELQAALLSAFLPTLEADNARRRQIAARYNAAIRHPLVSTPNHAGLDYVAHLYVLRCAARDALREHLRGQGVGSDVHYPIPDHRQPVCAARYEALRLPHTEALAADILTLPCYPEMGEAEVEQVIAAVNSWTAR